MRLFTLGIPFVKYILSKVLGTRSQDLFGVTILAVVFSVAVGSSLLLGTSIALGAFIAGLVIANGFEWVAHKYILHGTHRAVAI